MPRPRRRVISGPTVMISGAAAGIGRSRARRLSAAGSPAAIADLDERGLTQTEGSRHGEVLSHVLDVADAGAQRAFARITPAHYDDVMSAPEPRLRARRAQAN